MTMAKAKGEAKFTDVQLAGSPPAGYLYVSHDEKDVIVNHPDLKPDAKGVGHIIFSPIQAKEFAALLIRHAEIIETGPKVCKCPITHLSNSYNVCGLCGGSIDNGAVGVKGEKTL